MKKICPDCGQECDAEQDFIWKYKDRGIRNTRCKFCQSQVSRQHYKNNKQSYLECARGRDVLVTEDNQRRLAEYLSNHPCVGCGKTDICCLEFDHVEGEKLDAVSKMPGQAQSWEKIEAEIVKCEVRFANCHRIKTLERGNWWRSRLIE